MTQEVFVQIVVSQLKDAATRGEFVELHRQTADWLVGHPDCVSYEVFEGAKGAIADRIVWSSRAGAVRGNEEYAKTDIAAGMQRIVASCSNFFGTPIDFPVASAKPIGGPITPKQGQYLAFIYYYAKLNRRAPSEADIRAYFGVTPPSVHQMLVTLERRGFISRVPGHARSTKLLVAKEQLPELA